MNEIGGYFQLELNYNNENAFPFQYSELLNSGRYAFEYLILNLPNKPSLIWLPWYTCEVMLEPLLRLGINYDFYKINSNLEISSLPKIGNNEYIIINNYFGIKDKYIDKMSSILGDKMIIDNSQALFYNNKFGLKSFYSFRKFVGVPDGGMAITKDRNKIVLDKSISYDKISHLLCRIDLDASSGYQNYKKNENNISNIGIHSMSNLSKQIISNINFEYIKEKRNRNFSIINSYLSDINLLNIPAIETFSCPMAYPLLTDDTSLKEILINNRIYIPTFWPNIFKWCKIDSLEYKLGSNLIAIPIDQRYGDNEMRFIANIIIDHINKSNKLNTQY